MEHSRGFEHTTSVECLHRLEAVWLRLCAYSKTLVSAEPYPDGRQQAGDAELKRHSHPNYFEEKSMSDSLSLQSIGYN